MDLPAVAWNLSAATAAGIAAFSPYPHVALRHDERPEVARALPFSVMDEILAGDGMPTVVSVVVVDDRCRGWPGQVVAGAAVPAGARASITATVAAAPPPGARIAGPSGWPPTRSRARS